MNILEVDKNFAPKELGNQKKIVYYDVSKPPFSLYGINFDENTQSYYRADRAIEKVNDGLHYLNQDTAGGRVRFSTNSNVIYIKATYPCLAVRSNMSIIGQGGFVLCENTSKGEKYVVSLTPQPQDNEQFTGTMNLPKGGRMRNYTLYFPLYNHVNKVYLGINKKSTIASGLKYRDILPILYYGSSITQGASASRPDTCYEAIIAKRNNIDFINYGFSGRAKGEDGVIDVLKKVDCSVFVLDYDYNAPTVEDLENTHYKVYSCFRQAHPNTPIIMISRPNYYLDNVEKSSKPRFKVIQKSYLKAVENGDKNVYLIEGKSMFGKHYDICTIDGSHPNDLGFYFMANTIGKLIDKIIK